MVVDRCSCFFLLPLPALAVGGKCKRIILFHYYILGTNWCTYCVFCTFRHVTTKTTKLWWKMDTWKWYNDTSEAFKRRRSVLVDDSDEIALQALYKSMFSTKKRQKRKGSQKGRRMIERDTIAGGIRLHSDYFSESPTYPSDVFRRRFRMPREIYERVKEVLVEHDPSFEQLKNAAGKWGGTTDQKLTAALRMLAYGAAADSLDEYLRLSEDSINLYLRKYVKGVVECFGTEYLREPTDADLQRLLADGVRRGFPGMIGSIDCMHWTWKNCPTRLAGQHKGKAPKPTLVLEAVADYYLWFWHFNFGEAGSCNDINVLDNSHVMDPFVKGERKLHHAC